MSMKYQCVHHSIWNHFSITVLETSISVISNSGCSCSNVEEPHADVHSLPAIIVVTPSGYSALTIQSSNGTTYMKIYRCEILTKEKLFSVLLKECRIRWAELSFLSRLSTGVKDTQTDRQTETDRHNRMKN